MKKSLIAALMVVTLPFGVAMAQDQPSDQAPHADRKQAMEQFNKRFADADADGDGKLTREEAAKMPFVAAHFDEIDVGHKGYVTKMEVGKAMRKMMAERKAEKAAGTAPAPTN